MDLFEIRDVVPIPNVSQTSAAIKIQSFFKMKLSKCRYQRTLSRLQSERKRAISEIEETSNRLNNQTRLHKHECLIKGRKIIYQNFPGIQLEQEKFYGRYPNERVTLKAKKDNIGRTCPIALRQHSKNSIYFIINIHDFSVYVKCFTCDGSRELSDMSNIYEDIKNKIVISDKVPKKCKTVQPNKLESLDHISIVKFEHSIIELDTTSIMDIYDANSFVYTAAYTHRKSPVLPNWTTRTADLNEPINFSYNNICIVCGKNSNIFVVDIDINDEGLVYWQKLCTVNNYRYDNSTTCVLTPSGGIHLYYLYDEAFSNNSVKMTSIDGKKIGIDIRSNGGCVIAPPSSYANGTYKFLCVKRPQLCPAFIKKLFV